MKNHALLHRPVLIVALLLLAVGPASASQIVVVTPTPGNPTQSGNDLLAALAGITGNSWSKRFVLQLEPGVYNLGNQNIQMKQYVDIAGSGVESTFVYGNGNTAAQNIARGLIQGADFAELRDVTVRVFATVDRQYLLPIFLPGVDTRITNVVTQAFTADEYCGGIYAPFSATVIRDVVVLSSCNASAYGIVFETATTGRPSVARTSVIASSSSAVDGAQALLIQGGNVPTEIRDSSFVASGGSTARGMELGSASSGFIGTMLVLGTTITGTGGASQSYGFDQPFGDNVSVVFEHSTVQATGSPSNIGIHARGGAVTSVVFENGVVEGSTNTVVEATGLGVRIGASRMAGGPVSAFNITCAGVYDENHTFFASTCP